MESEPEVADHGLLKGKRIAIDATTLEANAAMRSIVRRDTGASSEEFLIGLTKASGIAAPTREQLARLDRKRKRASEGRVGPINGGVAATKDEKNHREFSGCGRYTHPRSCNQRRSANDLPPSSTSARFTHISLSYWTGRPVPSARHLCTFAIFTGLRFGIILALIHWQLWPRANQNLLPSSSCQEPLLVCPWLEERTAMPIWENLASTFSTFGIGLLVVSLGLAAKRLLRFCRHKRMGWPTRQNGYTYQACLDCGIQRLFDERRFQPYGDYGYDLTRMGAVRDPIQKRLA